MNDDLETNDGAGGMATLYLLTGPWASGKSTLVPHLARLLPEVVVFDWDALLPGLSVAADTNARTDVSTWGGLMKMWIEVVGSVLAGGRGVLLCGPTRPPELSHSRISRHPMRCAYLDCANDTLAARLLARGDSDAEIAEELADMAALRRSSYHPVRPGEREPEEVAAEVAAWVRACADGTHVDVPGEPLPIHSVVDLPTDEAAAWIALFYLRSGVPEGLHAPPLYLLGDSDEPVPAADAVAVLAERPKPLMAIGRVTDAALAIRWRPVPDDPGRLTAGYLRNVADMYRSFSVRRVLFAGRDEALVATVHAALRWARDYRHCISSVGDELRSDWSAYQGLYATAAAAGADFIHLVIPTPFDQAVWEAE